MDADFISELDKAISSIGTDKVWERTVGGIRFLLSPVSYEAQGKINEAMSSQEMGSNSLSEAKRITLAHAIVGVNDYDLREYRGSGPSFPIMNREGKKVAVTLDKYIYEKSQKWGGQLIDDLFSVYADLMESFQKENLHEIKFENMKNPVEELGELMLRVAELRDQLRLPQLVDPDDDDFAPRGVQAGAEEEKHEPTGPDFDPFRTVPQAEQPRRVVRPVSIPDSPAVEERPVALTPDDLDTVPTAPVVSSINAPHVPKFASPDVIEDRAESRPPVPPPAVDRPPATSVNPRFARPSR